MYNDNDYGKLELKVSFMFSFVMYYCCNLKYAGTMSLYTHVWRALGTIPGCSFLFSCFDEGF